MYDRRSENKFEIHIFWLLYIQLQEQVFRLICTAITLLSHIVTAKIKEFVLGGGFEISVSRS